MRFISLLILILAALQIKFWHAKGNYAEYQHQVKQHQLIYKSLQDLQDQNFKLENELRYIKNNTEALEEKARHDFGLKKFSETFVLIKNVSETND